MTGQFSDREAYLITAGPLDQCIREFMAKPEPTRHVYEIHTARQPPLIMGVLSTEHIAELARLKELSLKTQAPTGRLLP
jgi:hypothetical protein